MKEHWWLNGIWAGWGKSKRHYFIGGLKSRPLCSIKIPINGAHKKEGIGICRRCEGSLNDKINWSKVYG